MQEASRIILRIVSLAAFFYLVLIPATSGAEIKKGDLQIKAQPGIRVFLNDEFRGETVAEQSGLIISDLEPATYTLRFEKEDYYPQIATIKVYPGEISIYFVDPLVMKVESVQGDETDIATGTIIIRSLPIDCSLTIESLGISNFKKEMDSVTLKNVIPGEHPAVYKYDKKVLTSIIEAVEGGTTFVTVNFLKGTVEQEKPNPQDVKPLAGSDDPLIQHKVAVIKTNLGDMYFFFFPEKAPNHVRNFIQLAEEGFFKNVKFHRIVRGFMAQAGIQRDDWQQELIPLKLEVDPDLIARHRRGALSAARTNDPDSATSQFFIVFSEYATKRLDGLYTVYGQLFKGIETLDKIEDIPTGKNEEMGGEISLPLEDIHIIDIVIEDDTRYKADIDAWKAENGM